MHIDTSGLDRVNSSANAAIPINNNFRSKISVYQIPRRFYASITVVRLVDRRVLFPFVGAPQIGPFGSFSEAKTAADTMIVKVIADDIANPET